VSFEEAKDVILIAYAVVLSYAYARREPYFVYVATPAILAVTWEATFWEGSRSVVTLSIIAVVELSAIAIRRLSSGDFITSEARDPTAAAILCIAALPALLVLLGFPLSKLP
jgi:hypothetical protein